MFLLHLGPYFVGDEVTDNVEKEFQTLESSEYLEKFRKCISVTFPQGLGPISPIPTIGEVKISY